MPRNLPKQLFLTVFIVIICIARLYLAVNRYIDPDEFAHLHWTYLLSLGKLPYKDFFAYHIPFFQFVLLPAFLLPADAAIVIVTRLWIFLLYIGVVVLLYQIALKITGEKIIGLLALALFIIFPMTFDKTVDVRPDMLMVFLFLAATVPLWKSKEMRSLTAAFVGTAFALSLLAFPKILFALPSLVYLFFSTKGAVRTKSLLFFCIGLAAPIFGFLLYLFAHGIVSQAIVAMTQWSVAVNTGKIPFPPWWALSPWPIVYVTAAGPSFPWAVNTAIWILGALGLVPLWRIHKRAAIFLFLFFAGGFGFLFMFPAPYTQYFLPLSVFAGFLAAVSLFWFFARLPNTVAHSVLFLLCAVLGASFLIQFLIRTAPGVDNSEQMHVIGDILAVTQPTETVYDMVGSYIFRPDGYFICCHPYGEFVTKLRPIPPTLRESLVANKTKFVVLDRTGLVFWQAPEPDLSFLLENYVPSTYLKIYVIGSHFVCTNSACTQIDLSKKSFGPSPTNQVTILIDETYTVATTPPGLSIAIDRQTVHDTQTLHLTPGTHTFSSDSRLSSFQIKLAR